MQLLARLSSLEVRLKASDRRMAELEKVNRKRWQQAPRLRPESMQTPCDRNPAKKARNEEHRIHTPTYSWCGKATTAEIPVGVPSECFGPNAAVPVNLNETGRDQNNNRALMAVATFAGTGPRDLADRRDGSRQEVRDVRQPAHQSSFAAGFSTAVTRSFRNRAAGAPSMVW